MAPRAPLHCHVPMGDQACPKHGSVRAVAQEAGRRKNARPARALPRAWAGCSSSSRPPAVGGIAAAVLVLRAYGTQAPGHQPRRRVRLS